MAHDTEYLPPGATLSHQARQDSQPANMVEELVPKPPFDFHVVLFEPEIPPNTGNAGRLCVATQSTLHIVGKPAFSLTDKAVRRAGLDYWKYVKIMTHKNFDEWLHWQRTSIPDLQWLLMENGTEANGVKPSSFYETTIFAKAAFIFGKETVGLPKEILQAHHDKVREIPMFSSRIRSLNLSNAIAMTLYEAIRQNLKI
jgi:tRNA (cytidine/uridine-2'-O-)-methyltransferase